MRFIKKNVAAFMTLMLFGTCGIASAERVDMTLDEGIQMALEKKLFNRRKRRRFGRRPMELTSGSSK